MSSQPSVDPHRWRTGADLELLEVILGQGDEPVLAQLDERAQVGLDGVGGRVGDPDAGPVVGDAGREIGRLTVTEPAEVPHRPVQHRVAATTIGCDDRLGEEDRVLVGEQPEVGVELGLVAELHGPEPSPVGQVVGDGQREAWSERAVGDVGHHRETKAGDVRRPRVLDTGVVGPALPAGVGREHHALARHADGHAVRAARSRRARPATRCPSTPCAAAGAGCRRGCGRWPG